MTTSVSYPSRINCVRHCNQYWLVVFFPLDDHARGIHLGNSITAHGEGAKIQGIYCQHVQHPRLLWGYRYGVHGQNFVRVILISQA